jgi:hypothetical protein
MKESIDDRRVGGYPITESPDDGISTPDFMDDFPALLAPSERSVADRASEDIFTRFAVAGTIERNEAVGVPIPNDIFDDAMVL